MKKNNIYKVISTLIFTLLVVASCSKDESSSGSNNVIENKTPTLNTNKTNIEFEDTQITKSSTTNTFYISSQNLNSDITVSVGDNFEISENNISFTNNITVQPNQSKTLYVRFSPSTLGSHTGSISITNSQVNQKTISLSGNAIKLRYNYKTYNREHLAFGSGLSQSSVKKFDLHNDMSKIENIKMYVQLECPSAGCNAWDVFANILVKEPVSN